MNPTHKLFMFVFYFLLHVSLIHIDHMVEKHRYKGKSATLEAIHSQSYNNTLDIIPKKCSIKNNKT